MRKPLGLPLYPPLPPLMQAVIKENLQAGLPAYAGLPYVPETGDDKRFTDAELAAEYWRSWNNVKTGSAEARDWDEYDRAMTIRRFATTPSHDEVPLQSESEQAHARTPTAALPGEGAPADRSRESRNQEPGRSDPGSTRRGCVRDRAIEGNRAKPAADLPNQAGEVTQETRENRGLQSPELTNRLVTTGTKRGATGTAIPATPSHSTTDQGELL